MLEAVLGIRKVRVYVSTEWPEGKGEGPSRDLGIQSFRGVRTHALTCPMKGG